jgi:hypothetical protein
MDKKLSDTGPDTKLQRLYCALAESSLKDTDEEVTRAIGPEAPEKAEKVRLTLLDGVKAYRQRALNDAMIIYREELKRFKESQFKIPSSVGEKRQLLESVFQRFPQGERTFLTLQHRGFKNLSDADVESCLRQLEALGVLDGESR